MSTTTDSTVATATDTANLSLNLNLDQLLPTHRAIIIYTSYFLSVALPIYFLFYVPGALAKIVGVLWIFIFLLNLGTAFFSILTASIIIAFNGKGLNNPENFGGMDGFLWTLVITSIGILVAPMFGSSTSISTSTSSININKPKNSFNNQIINNRGNTGSIMGGRRRK